MFVAFRFEEGREFESAKKVYERAANEFGSKEASDALEKLQLAMSKQKNGCNLIDLTDDDEEERRKVQRNQQRVQQNLDAEARRKRLKELEKFKESLEAKRGRR